ncbi:MAG: hypothetical protein KA810_14795 [Pyrinomonadaceae bacterium]|nr:hypothetical protein [Pyrinomonadaceae bacterium]
MSLRMETDKAINVITEGAIEPWERLTDALAEQKALEASKSDEAADAGRLAVSICGLAGQFGLNSRDMAARSDGWALLSAAADASKNRLLSSAAKRTTLAVSAHFEADDDGGYRFINNRIMIVHPTMGSSEFLTTAANAIRFLIAELGLDLDWTPRILEGPPEFAPTVVLDAGPDPNYVFELLQVRFLKRNPDGDLVLFQPQNWQLELKTTT